MSFSVKASLISTRQCQTDSLLDSLGYYKKQQPCLESRLMTHRNYKLFKKFHFYYIFTFLPL